MQCSHPALRFTFCRRVGQRWCDSRRSQRSRLLTGTANRISGRAGCAPPALAAQGFDATHTVDDCSGKPTYFAMETGFRYTESLGAGALAPRDLFTAFVKAAESKCGCAKS